MFFYRVTVFLITDRNGNVPQPDPQVTKLENEVVKDLSTAMARTSLGDELPRRPNYGTVGKAIILFTNYVAVQPNKDLTLYRTTLAVQGESNEDRMPKPKKRRLIQQLLQAEQFAGLVSATDGAQVIITNKKPKIEGREAIKIEWFPADGEPLAAATADEPEERKKARQRNTFTLLVESLGTVSVNELLKDLSSGSVTYPLKLETIQALNILMAQGPSTDSKITVAGQNRFYPVEGHAQHVKWGLGGGLEALRGYYSSVRTSINRIILNVNVATAAFYKPGPLLDMLGELGGNQGDPKRMSAFVKKLRFETSYITEKDTNGKVKTQNGRPVTKRKVHVIHSLSFKGADNITFETTGPNGKIMKVTVKEHFAKSYNVQLKSPRAPVVNYGDTKNPKWIPAELCTILPGQMAKRLLLGEQTSQMIRFAARSPADNADSIVNHGFNVAMINHVQKFGLKVDPKLLTVNGRILEAPLLQYKTKTTPARNGAWNLDVRTLGNQPFRIAKTLAAWNCLVIEHPGKQTIYGGPQGVMHLLNEFRKTLATYGMNPGPVQAPARVEIAFPDVLNRNIGKIQAQIEHALKTGFKGKPQFLFVILPSDNSVIYDSVKFVCDVTHGIPNICNIGSKFSKEKGQMQYFANVAMKFNQKLGGVNHTLQPDRFKPLDKDTILFGIDVTHPSPGSSESSPSIAGIVASVDQNFSQYPASIRTQKGRAEMVQELEEMILERLRLWQKRNMQRLPNKVVVYRDGVSEGQYKLVLEKELPAFTAAFNILYGKPEKHPKISIVVVGKRHHTRFYPTKAEDADDRTGNPKPGTIVDRGVTGEKLFDFFLLAHQGLQGTSKPAHYVVIKDDNKFGADQLQGLTHNLCYTFARATRSVSICPPAYYADLLCERGRSYLQGVLKGDGSEEFTQFSWRKNVHPNLAETMFYL